MKRSHWAAVITVTVALVALAPEEEQSTAGADNMNTLAELVHEAESPGGAYWLKSGRVELERLASLEKKRRERLKVSDVFNSTSWYVPPPPPKYVAPPPPPVIVPTAPALPFTFLGFYGDASSRFVILSRGDRVYTVAAGEIIDNMYRVEQATGGRVDLTYLPLNIRQSLATGNAL